MNNEISILTLMCILSIFQWLIGPLVYYSELNPGMTFEITKMQVNKSTYFNLAFPATLAFCAGLSIFRIGSFKTKLIIEYINNNLDVLKSLGKKLVITAIIFDLFKHIAPIQIKQYVFFLGYLKYMGLSILLLDYYFLKSKLSRNYFLLALTLTIISVIKELMFGELVFAAALIALITLPLIKPSFIKRVVTISLLVVLVVVIQLIKPYSRQYMWKSKQETSLSILVKNIQNQNLISIDNVKSKWFIGYSIARFNQGSIISWTMKQVPKRIPFEEGKTIVSSTFGAFIPRLLWPNKPLMGKDMYVKYTGLRLEGASYGISQLGESYINFGIKGSVYFMLILGLIYNLIHNKIIMLSKLHPAIYFILPILFLHGIKVETDITRSLGFIIRYSLFLYVLNLILNNLFHKRIF